MPNNFIYLFSDKDTQFTDEEIPANIVLEHVKGYFKVVENGYLLKSSRIEPMYMLSKNNHVEIHLERNTIVKLKYFDATSYMSSIDNDYEALTYINHVITHR